ncbi:MAG: hypothetical protein F7B17_03450 [Desulfurococcales archaeon]|nr:hypothetical protein [Desulfurococcales archaeon]
MGSQGATATESRRTGDRGRYYAASAIQLYKALTLAYRRAREDEAWRVIHSSINNLLVKAERLEYLASRLGAGRLGWMAKVAGEVLRAVERGDKRGVVRAIEEAMDTMNTIGPFMEYTYVTSTGMRLTASMLSMLVSVVLGLGGVEVASLPPELALILAFTAGVSLGGVLLASHYLSEYIIAVAAGMLAGLLAFAATQGIPLNAEAAIAAVGAVLLDMAAIAYTDYTRRKVRRVVRSLEEH